MDVFRILAHEIGRHLSIQDRANCVLAHSCFQRVHESYKCHYLISAHDLKRKFATLIKYKPNLNNLSLNVDCISTRDFKDLLDISRDEIVRIEIFADDPAVYSTLLSVLDEFEGSHCGLHFSNLIQPENAETFYKLIERLMTLCSFMEFGVSIRKIDEFVQRFSTLELARLNRIHLTSDCEYITLPPVLAHCREVHVDVSSRFGHTFPPGFLNVATHVLDDQFWMANISTQNRISELQNCSRLQCVTLSSFSSSMILAANLLQSVVDIPATTFEFKSMSLFDPVLIVVIERLVRAGKKVSLAKLCNANLAACAILISRKLAKPIKVNLELAHKFVDFYNKTHDVLLDELDPDLKRLFELFVKQN